MLAKFDVLTSSHLYYGPNSLKKVGYERTSGLQSLPPQKNVSRVMKSSAFIFLEGDVYYKIKKTCFLRSPNN